MSLRWLARVDAEWRRAESLLNLLDRLDAAGEAAVRQAVLLQVEYAASCYALECMPPGSAVAVEPALLRQARGRRWQEFFDIVKPLLHTADKLRHIDGRERSSEALKNPLFATAEESTTLIARDFSASAFSVDEVRAVLREVAEVIARQRAEAEES